MRFYKLGILFTIVLFFLSCSTTTSVSFLCNEEDLQIYVNDDYVGTGLVRYIVPKNVTTAVVECKKDGVTIYTKNYYIKGHNNELFDIIIPKSNTYSSDRQIHSK